MSRPSAGARLMFVAMLAAIPLVIAAKVAAVTPPPLPAGADRTPISRNVPGVSATPERTWRAVLAVYRENGVPVPTDARWGYLPWDVPDADGTDQVLGGLADHRTNTVLINPMLATGDARDLAVTFAHEAGHLASYQVETRGGENAVEEAATEAVARDFIPVIRRRLLLDGLTHDAAYDQQLSPLVRGTTRACRAAMPAARAVRVTQCARHTRRWFLTATNAERQEAMDRWGVRIPGIPPRPAFLAWISDYAGARTIGQQLQHERAEWRARELRYRRTIRSLTYRPDAEVAFQLAGLAYGQDWRHLRACALSEAYRNAERYQRTNARPNRGGSGATGPFQFMRSTYLSTPQGRAGLDWHRVDVQAHAAAWMWAAGRRGEWTVRGC